MKRCLIYSNCQGEAILHFLNQCPAFKSTYTCQTFHNYKMILDKSPLPDESIAEADLFLYQPLVDSYDNYSTRHWLSLLPDHCQSLSFPYLYNSALWPIFEEGDYIRGAEPIHKLFQEGATFREVIRLFTQQKISFPFETRLKKTLSILTEKESHTDVKAAAFIEQHLQSHKLFLTQNHPSSYLLIHCANQLLKALALPLIDSNAPTLNEYGFKGTLPDSPYEQAFYQFDYTRNSEELYKRPLTNNWKYIDTKLIYQIYTTNHSPTPKDLIHARWLMRSIRQPIKAYSKIQQWISKG